MIIPPLMSINPLLTIIDPLLPYPMMISEKNTMAIAGFFNAMPLLIIPLAIGMESYLCNVEPLPGPSFRGNKVPGLVN